ncbi:MAG: hypothetical protein GTN84_15865 [Hydrogenophaga sp.]|uniref:hypothetical protein n=1 Tax=Hydrogenophaga sp. TaxID=1904254 RepID=UPI0016B52929|nr:hypothetical protein [Hydrogenophaga sp.]NIM42854.1 hypothetical protein [Hydrogenophaga sp.]NIN27787.1 hypothetical protein [Hydrogenophaga sp.]NIN32606.1 hypothetical protein [Hydrogenophaga sp.]NIN57060.1 hypothetical protein [Hydrogenophaga sp.]NIO53471.1 hypothetical protein [Hydrogenophaga sp.]
MSADRLNPEELRASMRLTLTVIMAPRIARGLSLDRERVRAIQGLLEERVTVYMVKRKTSAPVSQPR